MSFLSVAFCTAALAQTPIDVGALTCTGEVPKRVAVRDPDSIRVGEAAGGKMEVITYADQRMPARKYTVAVSAKNIYGAYGVTRQLICYTSEDGRRVLRMDAARFD